MRDGVGDLDVEAAVAHAASLGGGGRPGPYGRGHERRAAPCPVDVRASPSSASGATLLTDVDWTVREGERWVVLGPERRRQDHAAPGRRRDLLPTRGTVDLLGERFGEADLGELRTRVGLSSAALADRVPPHERAVDVVVTAAHGVLGRWSAGYDSGDVDRAVALLGRVGLRAFVDRRFGSLSEGERKRVLLARALMTDPELLLLDEPAAGLDLGSREALLHLLARLAADPAGPPSVLVTHHVEEVPLGVTHALLLGRGRTLAAGPVAEVLTAPLLSRAFSLPLVVESAGGRYTARAALR